MKKSKHNFSEHIELDSWSASREYFKNEAEFVKELVEDYKSLNDMDSDCEFVMLDQNEVVIPDVKVAYITFDLSSLEGVSTKFPVFAKFPNMTQEEFEALERGEKLPEVVGITRGNLQWQIQNTLSGLPLFDHRFPEGLYLEDTIDCRPVYHLALGS